MKFQEAAKKIQTNLIRRQNYPKNKVVFAISEKPDGTYLHYFQQRATEKPNPKIEKLSFRDKHSQDWVYISTRKQKK